MTSTPAIDVVERALAEAPQPVFDDPLLDRIYRARGIGEPTEMEQSLARLPHVSSLAHAQAAGKLLADAIVLGQRIVVVGDFDADGATGSAVAVSLLRACAGRRHELIDFVVPDRLIHGYGLTPAIIELPQVASADVLLTVDNGVASVDGVAAANELSIKVVITDHHLPGAELPAAAVLVNPNVPGCSFESKAIAGVGVVFYVMSALRAELRARKWFEQQQIPEPVLASVLDLVALGTVADVVPLDRVNRILVAQGLARIRQGAGCAGIRALAHVARKKLEHLTAEDLAFAIAPRLNAAGRLANMSLGIQCLLAPTEEVARALAEQLDDINRQRRDIEREMTEQAARLADAVLQTDLEPGREQLANSLCLHEASWHPGVIGIVAGRVRERTQRPVIAFAVDTTALAPGVNGPMLLRGSARSVPDLHLRDALHNVANDNPDLILRFGGHAMAAGLTIEARRLNAFRAAFSREVDRWLGSEDPRAMVQTDGGLPVAVLTLATAQQLAAAGPWGQKFEEPQFCDEFRLVSCRVFSERVSRYVLSRGSALYDAVWFGAPHAQVQHAAPGLPLRVVYRLGVNRYRDATTLELRVAHLEPWSEQ